MIQKLKETQAYIESRAKGFKPVIGIILGTGLDQLVDKIDIRHTLTYDELPHFPVSTVTFHSGNLIFGYLGGKPVVCMQGRFHYYEGYSMQEVAYPVRVMKLLGVKKLMVSNAAGGLNPTFKESDLMIIEDHISLLLPTNPLVGENIMGDRFPDMSEPYDHEMIALAKEIVKQNKIEKVTEGVYISVTGPQLETKAEYRMIRNMGADAVGMSTVPEVITAVQMGMRVFAVSIITDICNPDDLQKADINKIIAAAGKAEPSMTLLFEKLIEKI